MRTAPQPLGISGWSTLLLAWGALCISVGVVMFGVTTFLFAFSDQQYRMVAVVQIGFWVAQVLAFGVGFAALMGSRSARVAVLAMLTATAAVWMPGVFVEWRVS